MAEANDINAPEVWKSIPGFEGSFEASTLGRIKALRRHAGSRWYEERIMALIPFARGYFKVNLSYNGKIHQRRVHQLILETFVGPCPVGMECLHGDGDKANNSLANLKWGTSFENAADRDRHGRTKRGVANARAVLSEPMVREVRRQLSDGVSAKAVARNLAIGHNAVYAIRDGRTWTHLV